MTIKRYNNSEMNISKDFLFERHKQLMEEGLESYLALGRSALEYQLQTWPEEWGDYLHFFIYGDFESPKNKVIIEDLGITLFPEKVAEGPFRYAHCNLKGNVKIREKSQEAIVEACHKISILLGVWTFLTGGSSGCGWWSSVTHQGGAVYGSGPFDESDLEIPISRLLQLPPEIRRKVEGALFWIREPRKVSGEIFKVDTLRIFSGYWNAFECLIDAINIKAPKNKIRKGKKNKLLHEFIKKGPDNIDIVAFQQFYRTVVDPGFIGKAEDALRLCFGNEADPFIKECFSLEKEEDRLYMIRNAINHGEVDAEDFMEGVRIRSRFKVLWQIVWNMIGYFLGYEINKDAGPSR